MRQRSRGRVRPPTSVCTPINNETLGHNYATAYQDKGSVLPRIICERFLQFEFKFNFKYTTDAAAITHGHKQDNTDKRGGLTKVFHLCRSTKITSLCSEGRSLFVHRESRPSLTWVSALACSFEMRPCSLPMGQHTFLCFGRLPFQIVCSLPHLPCLDTSCFMGCSASADFSKCDARSDSCCSLLRLLCLLCGPTIGEFLGSGGWIFAGTIRFVLQTVLFFLACSSSSAASEATRVYRIAFLMYGCCLFDYGFEGSVFLRQGVPKPVLSFGSSRRPCRSLPHSSCTWH